jgi:hypothetical protein
MISSEMIAKQVSGLMLGVSDRLAESVVMVNEACPLEESRLYRSAAGKILAGVLKRDSTRCWINFGAA